MTSDIGSHPAWPDRDHHYHGLVLFDIDGTLLQAGDRDHHLAFVQAMEEIYGLPATLDGVPMAGMLDSQIARLALGRHGLADDEIDRDLAKMIESMGLRYTAAVARGSRIERRLPGAVETATLLRDHGFALGVLTGNARLVARAKLAAADVGDLFPAGAYGDTAHDRAHLVEDGLRDAARHYGVTFGSRQTVLIGDTPRDIAAARDGDALVVGVATGRYSVEDLAEHEPEAVFPDLRDATSVVAKIEAIIRPTRD